MKDAQEMLLKGKVKKLSADMISDDAWENYKPFQFTFFFLEIWQKIRPEIDIGHFEMQFL